MELINHKDGHPFDYGAHHLENELKHDHKEADKEHDLLGHTIAPAAILIATFFLAVGFIVHFSNSSPVGKTNKERVKELLETNITKQ